MITGSPSNAIPWCRLEQSFPPSRHDQLRSSIIQLLIEISPLQPSPLLLHLHLRNKSRQAFNIPTLSPVQFRYASVVTITKKVPFVTKSLFVKWSTDLRESTTPPLKDAASSSYPHLYTFSRKSITLDWISQTSKLVDEEEEENSFSHPQKKTRILWKKHQPGDQTTLLRNARHPAASSSQQSWNPATNWSIERSRAGVASCTSARSADPVVQQRRKNTENKQQRNQQWTVQNLLSSRERRHRTVQIFQDSDW
jgi:hypothetical protein